MSHTSPTTVPYRYNYDHRSSAHSKTAAMIFRGVLGRDWGWFSGDERRMHIRTLDHHGPRVTIVLEERGVPTFQVVEGRLDPDDLSRLRAAIESSRTRIHEAWTQHLVDRGWLGVEQEGTAVIVTVHPGTEFKFSRRYRLSRLAFLPGSEWK